MNFARYDRIVSHYANMWPLLIPGYIPILNSIVDIVRTLEQRPKKILDIGCGPGSATVAVAPACNPEGHVVLVDGSEAMLTEAKRLLGGHVRTAHHGDFTDPTLMAEVCRPNTYDLVLASFALHHITDAEKSEVIMHLGRSVQPGGILLLADETSFDRPAGWDVIEKIRGRIVEDHIGAGRINPDFWKLETTLPQEAHLPFLPARIEDLTSWIARSDLAVTSPVNIFGSTLMLATKPKLPT